MTFFFVRERERETVTFSSARRTRRVFFVFLFSSPRSFFLSLFTLYHLLKLSFVNTAAKLLIIIRDVLSSIITSVRSHLRPTKKPLTLFYTRFRTREKRRILTAKIFIGTETDEKPLLCVNKSLDESSSTSIRTRIADDEPVHSFRRQDAVEIGRRDLFIFRASSVLFSFTGRREIEKESQGRK